MGWEIDINLIIITIFMLTNVMFFACWKLYIKSDFWCMILNHYYKNVMKPFLSNSKVYTYILILET